MQVRAHMASVKSICNLTDKVSSLLEGYQTRNEIFRTTQYALAMLSGLLQQKSPVTANKLWSSSAAISNMRTTLRLLDDIPTLAYSMKTLLDIKKVLINANTPTSDFSAQSANVVQPPEVVYSV